MKKIEDLPPKPDNLPDFPTFIDEVFARIPMDRWVGWSEIRVLVPHVPVTSIRNALTKGVKDGLLLRKEIKRPPRRGKFKNLKHQKGQKVYAYIRISTGRVIGPRDNAIFGGKDAHTLRGGYKPKPKPPEKEKKKRDILPPEKVREIRRLYESKAMTISALALMYGKTPRAIHYIVRRQSYRYVF